MDRDVGNYWYNLTANVRQSCKESKPVDAQGGRTTRLVYLQRSDSRPFHSKLECKYSQTPMIDGSCLPQVRGVWRSVDFHVDWQYARVLTLRFVITRAKAYDYRPVHLGRDQKSRRGRSNVGDLMVWVLKSLWLDCCVDQQVWGSIVGWLTSRTGWFSLSGGFKLVHHCWHSRLVHVVDQTSYCWLYMDTLAVHLHYTFCMT